MQWADKRCAFKCTRNFRMIDEVRADKYRVK